MSVRATIILFVLLFSAGLFLIVILPLVLSREPAEDRPVRRAGKETIQELGLFRSDDGGRTWVEKSWVEGQASSVAAFKINRLIANPARPEMLFLATEENGLWLSENRGDLWAEVQDSAGVLKPNANVLDLAINPDDPQEWYVAAFQENRGRLLRTADGGKSFSEIYFTPVERYGVFDVHYDRGRKTVGIVTGQGGFLETADQGRTWRVVRWFSDGLIRLLVNPANEDVRLVVSPRGSIFRTLDRGQGWEDATPALRLYSGATANQRWLFDDFGTIYVGSNYGLLRSRNNASSFEAPPLIIPPDALPVLAVAIAPQNRRYIMVSAGGEIYRSKDSGETWEIMSGPTARKGKVRHLWLDAKNSETIYAVVE